MFNFYPLEKKQSKFANLLRKKFPFLRNIFNPSVLLEDNTLHVTFRAIEKSESKISAYYSKIDLNSYSTLLFKNLSDDYKKLGIMNVADPKLLILKEEVYVTFNTGYSRQYNEIYLHKLLGDASAPLRMNYPHRKRVEKNWSFFYKENELFVLYGLNPLTILKVEHKQNDELLLSTHYREEKKFFSKKLSIGTQLVQHGDTLYLIAHRKLPIGLKRIYWGVPISITHKKNIFSIRIYSLKLIHSYKSLLGTKPKHNKNLISCSYFSGATIDNNSVTLSYGINDADYGITNLKMEDIWK